MQARTLAFFGAAALLPCFLFRGADAGAADLNILNPAFVADSATIPGSGSRRMETRFSPCSSHTFIVDKSGSFVGYSSVADEKTFTFDVKDAVYEVGDHGPTGMLVHPDFPATPSIFMYYTADPTNKWKDSCTMAPDADGFTYCDTKQRLHRFDLTVTMTGTRCTAFALAKSQVLVEDWCSISLSHGNGNIEWYDGAKMILTSGDGAQPSKPDYGQRTGDVCYDAAKKLPQGRYRSQREDGFLQGKLLLFKAASLLKNAKLIVDTDFSVVAKGLRQPYVNTVNPWTGDVLIGDVGSKIWEEVNLITKAEMTTPSLWPLNFGWPCLEGRTDFANPTDDDFKWLKGTCDKTKGELCDICKTIWPCAYGVDTVGCSASFRPPAFQFRDTIDRDDSTLCRADTHALVALTWLVGADFGNTAIPYALVGSDYASGCIFYWDVDAATKRVKFENGASVLATNHVEGLYLTRGKDGFLYASKTGELNVLWKFGLLKSGGVANPTASLATFLLNDATGAYSVINCNAGCQIAAGSTIKFDASASTVGAGGGSIATYQFAYGDGTTSTKSATATGIKKYNAAGSFTPTVTVTDTGGRTDTDSVSVDVRASVASISTTPASGNWRLGNTIAYTMNGIVAGDVASVTWDATVSHCRPNACTGGIDCHTHTNGVDAGGSAFAGELTPPEHAMPSSMMLIATVTPKTGASYTVSAETTALQYKATVQAAIGATNVQTGWPVEVVDVNTCFSPCTVPFMARSSSDLAAPDVLYRGGKAFGFTEWSVAKAAGTTTQPSGTVAIVEKNMVLTARYAALTVTTDTANTGPALVGVAGYYGFIEVKWTVPTGGGYDWVLISVTAADGTDRSTAARATARKAIVGGLPGVVKTYTVKLAGYNSATKKKSVLGKLLTVSSSGDSSKVCYDQSSPYSGTPAVVPGTIEFENFDLGGEGAAYHDLTAGNSGGAAFRSNLDVDISTGGSGGYTVTQAAAGEWLQYTVTIAKTQDYSFTFYLRSADATKKTLYVMIDATVCNKANAVVVIQPAADTKGAFVGYATTAAMAMPAGEHTLTVCLATSGLELDRMVIAAA